MTSGKQQLLPSGFRDQLPPEASAEDEAVRILTDCFEGFGYLRVKPPLLEFEDSLFKDGPGSFLKDTAFRFMDPVSQKMLALRCDITAQIARIASSRLAQKQRPLRVMYANDVVRTNGSEQRVDRQFRQVGCEIMSEPSLEADVESLMIALQGLSNLGLKTVTVDLSYPSLLRALIKREPEKDAIMACLSTKDVAGLKRIEGQVAKKFADLISSLNSTDSVMSLFRGVVSEGDIIAGLDRVEALMKAINAEKSAFVFDALDLSFDLFETKGFEYHSGICFTFYSSDAKSEIGRGGRYEIQNSESACGFTFYMDALMPAFRNQKQQKHIFVKDIKEWSEYLGLQKQGWVVHPRIAPYDAPEICTHIYSQGEIKEKE